MWALLRFSRGCWGCWWPPGDVHWSPFQEGEVFRSFISEPNGESICFVSFFWKRWPYFCLRFYFQVSYKQLEGWLFVCLLICMLNLSLCLLMLQHWIACSQVKIAHMYSVEEFFPRQFLLSDFVWSSILILLPQLPHCQAQLEETSAVSG